MKILVPTDFSACAHHALDAAAQLAEKLNGSIHLYHEMPLPNDWNKMTAKERKLIDEEMQVIQNVNILFDSLKQEYPNVPITGSYSNGNLHSEIEQIVEVQKIDLIVMGSYGASGKKEYFIGSNTQKVVRSVHVPVLVIKEVVDTLAFKRAVFASSFSESEKTAFQYFINFLKPFNPVLHLVYVNTDALWGLPYAFVKDAMKDFEALCPFESQLHFLKDFSVERGVRHIADEIKADLIGISNHNRHPIKRILSGSNVELLVNHAAIPVMSIDFSESD